VTYFELIEAECANPTDAESVVGKNVMFRNLPVSRSGFYSWRHRATGTQAVATRGGAVAGTIFHADRGAQYTSGAVADVCTEFELRQSVRRTGVCWDNACSESFWSVFKHEYYYRHTFTTREELYCAIDRWMVYYNSRRRHSSNGQCSPINYEAGLDTGRLAA
jgi:putative transposase